MEQVENKRMKNFIFLLLVYTTNIFAADFSLWNKILTQVSGPKDCPQGNLTGNQALRLVRLGERIFKFTNGESVVEMTNIPGCEEEYRTTYDEQKNELTKNSRLRKCVQPTDDMEYIETLRVVFEKKSVKYSYQHTKTKLIKRKMICRYTYR